jgi:hypothetical protein
VEAVEFVVDVPDRERFSTLVFGHPCAGIEDLLGKDAVVSPPSRRVGACTG